MNDPASRENATEAARDNAMQYHKKDLWKEESAKFSRPHYRLEKVARIINKMAQGKECTLLDVGCGPATLAHQLTPNVDYYGIDIAIQVPAPNLLEADLLENPIAFGDKRFDIVLAQGFFEYTGEFQSQKLKEIAQLLKDGGTFIASYDNFGHRKPEIYWLYNNVQSLDKFRESLTQHFRVRRSFPTSHNWAHTEPNRELIKAVNMHFNANIPLISPKLAVEYFFICSRRLS